MNSPNYNTQNELLMTNLTKFYKNDNNTNLKEMLKIINGESPISLRIIDWFATNYAKKYFTGYEVDGRRFKVYFDYKLKLKAYSKRRFDPFCRWDRINVPYEGDSVIQTTIGQLNFFKWAIENKVLSYIEKNYSDIENDMNTRNSTSRRNGLIDESESIPCKNKTRKKREELSISATKSIKKETVEIVVSFN